MGWFDCYFSYFTQGFHQKTAYVFFLTKAYTIVTKTSKIDSWNRIVCIILANATYQVYEFCKKSRASLNHGGGYPSPPTSYFPLSTRSCPSLLLTVSMSIHHLSLSRKLIHSQYFFFKTPKSVRCKSSVWKILYKSNKIHSLTVPI